MKEKQLLIVAAGAVGAYLILKSKNASAAPGTVKKPLLSTLFPKSPLSGNLATGYGGAVKPQIPSVAGVRAPIVAGPQLTPTTAAIVAGSNLLSSLFKALTGDKAGAAQPPTKANPLGGGASTGGNSGGGMSAQPPSTVFPSWINNIGQVFGRNEQVDIAGQNAVGAGIAGANPLPSSGGLLPFLGWDNTSPDVAGQAPADLGMLNPSWLSPSIDVVPPENVDANVAADPGVSTYGPQQADANADQQVGSDMPLLDSSATIADSTYNDAVVGGIIEPVDLGMLDPSLLGGDTSGWAFDPTQGAGGYDPYTGVNDGYDTGS